MRTIFRSLALLGSLWCIVGTPLVAQQLQGGDPPAQLVGAHNANAAILSAGLSGTTTLVSPLVLFDCQDDRSAGSVDAGALHGSGRFVGGLIAGLLLGLIGTLIAWAVASGSNPQPEVIPDNVDEACYRDGYSAKAKSKNKSQAATGGLLGTAIFVTIYVAATSGNQ